MVPEVLDRRISRGRWASPERPSIFRPSQQPLGGGSAACKPVYLLLRGAPTHAYIAAALGRGLCA